jgi:hypothetical protein
MRSLRLYCCLMLAVGFRLPASLAAQMPVIHLAQMTEDRITHLPVAAASVVGVLAGGNNHVVGPDQPKVYLSANLQGKLCLQLRSQDGSFVAKAEYLLNHLNAGTYALEFRSAHPEFQRFQTDNLAVLAVLKSDCSAAPAPSDVVLPVFWGTAGFAFPVRVLLQTDHGDARLLSTKPGGPSVVCSQNGISSQLVFDQQCFLAAAWQPSLDKAVVVQIRDITGNYMPPATMTIVVP